MSTSALQEISDAELLRRHLRRSEPDAFAELVRRHLPMVFGCAHRQLEGDSGAAEDIAQEVFLRLAQQARSLASHPNLAGWCFVTTRHLTLTYQRTLVRRQSRELLTAMNPVSVSECNWEELAPVLDEAIATLSEADRAAVLCRYFERRAHGEIGAHLGISENAARMRVERALERLRSTLKDRGITSTATALALALDRQVLAEPPAGLGGRIVSQSALAVPAASGGLIGGTLAWFIHPVRLAVAVISVGGLLWWAAESHSSTAAGRVALVTQGDGVAAPAAGEAVNPTVEAIPQGQAAGLPGAGMLQALRLEVRNSAGLVLTNVPLHVIRWGIGEEDLTNGPTGVALINYPTNLETLEIITSQEGYVSARLKWQPGRGDAIPERYTLKLEPGVRLGGRVIDLNHERMPGATVRLDAFSEDAVAGAGPQSVFAHVEVSADSAGRWETRRMNEASLAKAHFNVMVPGYEVVGLGNPLRDSVAEGQLRAGTHVTRMQPGRTIHGIVVDPESNPVPDALVFCGGDPGECSNCPGTNSAPDGSFVLRGVASTFDTVQARVAGYALSAASLTNRDPAAIVRIELQRGRDLRLRFVDRKGNGLESVRVDLRTADGGIIPQGQGLVSDNTGRVSWTNAPSFSLVADLSIAGRPNRNLMPLANNGLEQTIQLDRPLAVSGTVRNARTGELIPRFLLSPGLLRDFGSRGKFSVWSREETAEFTAGRYQYELSISIPADETPDYILRCTADGFAPAVSQPLNPGERRAEVDFRLEPTIPTEHWIVNAGGQSVPDATIAPLRAGSHVTLVNGRLRASSPEDSLFTTDTEGRVVFPLWSEIERVVIAAPAGFALLSAAELTATRTIQLSQWGRIEGHLGEAGRPAKIKSVDLGDGDTFGLNPLLGWKDSATTLDGGGNFVFDRVPAGTHPLFVTGTTSKNAHSEYVDHQFLREVTVAAGETIKLDLASPRRTVTAHFRWAENVPEEWRAQAFVQLTSLQLLPPAGMRPNSAESQAWSREISQRRAPRRGRSYEGRFGPDGSIQFTNVDVGDYRLEIGVRGQPPKEFGAPGLAGGTIPVSVPAEPADEPLVAGEIVVELTGSP